MSTLTETLSLPGSNTPEGVTVTVVLAGENGQALPAGYATVGGETIVGRHVLAPDAVTGVWSVDLERNDQITPTGTAWKVVLSGAGVSASPRYVELTAAGTHDIADVLVEAPASVASSALSNHLTDTVGAHAASAVSVLDTAGTYTGTDVESVLAELPATLAADAAFTGAFVASVDGENFTWDGNPVDLGGGGSALPVNGGWWYTAPGSAATPFAIVADRIFTHPLQVPDTTLDRVGIVVTTAAAGSTIHLGVYADDGFGRPGALIAEGDAAVDSSTTGAKEATLTDCVVTGPQVWLAAVARGGTPSVRNIDLIGMPGVGFPSLTAANMLATGYYATAAAGALPASWGSTYAPTHTATHPRLFARVAPF